jgi:hypothetical protein
LSRHRPVDGWGVRRENGVYVVLFDKYMTRLAVTPIRPYYNMHSSSSNNRGSNSRSRQPHLDSVSPHAFPQPTVSPNFIQSPTAVPPQAFPSFPTPQYDYPPSPSNLSPPNWQRPRATSSYASESSTITFPEPQFYRSTSTRVPSPSPRTPRHDLDRSPRSSPALPPRKSATGPKTHGTEVAFK